MKSRKRKRTPIDEDPLKVKKAVTSRLGKKSPGRPRGPGNRNQPVEEEITFKSTKQSEHSQQQPSLSALAGGVANRIVLDTDSEDEDTEIALQYQLLGRQIPRSNMQESRSNYPPPTNSKRTTRSRSTSKPADTGREESKSPSVSAPLQKCPTILPPHKGAIAAISSREALKVYEKLERTNKKKEIQTIADFDKDELQEALQQVRKETRPPLQQQAITNPLRQILPHQKQPSARNVPRSAFHSRRVGPHLVSWSQMLLTNYALPARLRSLKHYFFLDRSDFFSYFFEPGTSKLRKPADNVNTSKFQSLLDLVLH